MNKHLFLCGVIALGISACGPTYVVHQDPPPPPPAPVGPPPPPPAPAPDVTYQTFYDQLSPYGQWINMPEYGYVWMPNASPDFKPYGTNGHWVCTDEGWAWESGYPWGWATFHYGRWFFQDGYGWMWIPGNEWAPAWVQWRNSDDYYGWAPIGPNVSISVSIGGGYTPPAHYWCFVPHQYVASPQVNNYYVHETNNVTIINRTTVINNYNIHNTTINNTTINNTTVNNNTTINNNNTTVINNNIHNNNRFAGGPDINEVSRYSGTQLRPIAVRESNTPGAQASGGAFAVYRPRVNAAPAGNSSTGGGFNRPAPTRVQTLENVQPVNRNSYGNNQPGFNRPVNNPPANNQPANNPPANTQPGFNRPENNNPYVRPGAPQPANNPPAGNQPTNNQPAGNPPAFNRPVNNPPANHPPANNQPANNQPATNRPAFNRPGNNPSAAQQQQNQAKPVQRFNRPNNNPQAKPVTNSPKPAPPKKVPPKDQKRDEPRRDNK